MSKLINKKRVVIVLLYLILAIILFCTLDIYFLGWHTFFSKNISKIIPYPAAVVNNDIITINQYESFLSDYKKYFSELVSGKGKNEQGLALQTIIRNKILEQAVSEFDIKVDNNEFNDFVQNFYQTNGIKDSAWNEKGFINYFIRPVFHRQKILERLKDDNLNKENKVEIEKIYNELLKNPDKFDEYASLHKDESLSFIDGSIGWLPYKDLPDGIQGRIDKMEINDFTSIIKSISGYHIYKLTGKVKHKDNGQFYYQFNQIFLPIKNLQNYLDSFLKNSKIYYFLKK